LPAFAVAKIKELTFPWTSMLIGTDKSAYRKWSPRLALVLDGLRGTRK